MLSNDINGFCLSGHTTKWTVLPTICFPAFMSVLCSAGKHAKPPSAVKTYSPKYKEGIQTDRKLISDILIVTLTSSDIFRCSEHCSWLITHSTAIKHTTNLDKHCEPQNVSAAVNGVAINQYHSYRILVPCSWFRTKLITNTSWTIPSHGHKPISTISGGGSSIPKSLAWKTRKQHARSTDCHVHNRGSQNVG